jgi:nitroreductase
MYKLLENRRSVRKYKPEKVDDQTVNVLIKSILRAPSGKRIDPWEFIYIDDPAILSQLAESKAHGSKLIKDAPQCIVFLADETKTDVWIEDASVAITIGHLAATDLGLGSCWVQIRNRKAADGTDSDTFVRDLLNIPENMRVEAVLAFGYPDEEKSGHSEDGLQLDKVYANQYGKSFL